MVAKLRESRATRQICNALVANTFAWTHGSGDGTMSPRLLCNSVRFGVSGIGTMHLASRKLLDMRLLATGGC